MTCSTTNDDSAVGPTLKRPAASRPETPSVVRSRTPTMYAKRPVVHTIQGRTPNLSFVLMSARFILRNDGSRRQSCSGEVAHPARRLTNRIGWNRRLGTAASHPTVLSADRDVSPNT